ncbi:MAG: hypothetical protein ACXABV_16360 [Candidatus Thorarchaeota archaeon]|jgi:hypothetical protein
MKTRWMHLIAGITMCILCISVCTTTVNADLVWEDNFDDGTYEPEWTTFGYANITSPVEIGGNFSAADYTLKVLDDDFNVARHESTTNVGTWSFDMFIPAEAYGFFYVDFMSNGYNNQELGNLSVLTVGADWLHTGPYRFQLLEGLGSSWHLLKDYTPDVFHGWHHIDVSRTSDGHFYVYFNGTLTWDFVDMSVTSSTYLSVEGYNMTGAAIDNLVVDDTIPTPSPTTTPTTPPTTTTPPPPPSPLDPIIIGGGVAVVVIVLVIVILRRR